MNVIISLFAVGMVLLGFEILVPGAVLGVLGAISLLVGIVMTFVHYGNAAGWWSVVIAGSLVVSLFVIELVLLPRVALGRKLFLRAAITEVSQPPLAPESLIGAKGQCATPLVPSGSVLIQGRRYEASSQSGMLEAGTNVCVVGIDNFRLIVTKDT